ncbi:alpha-hydroxy-acid oxidizing enzyme [Rhizocola hellebori]|uniref:Alpha-hydroxy-acid oxidizing enzyme n=1 Tax=Rhizocola hellebori TaxID=1392758 RepID=A0A8J3VI90_9ACTN|nr:alpha-hydroxy acid oxidase [Rhizocola hellebori]GIH06776.1 alpha-hydroxy-acid oxidizing enzyme [Rhizocola hellebori]
MPHLSVDDYAIAARELVDSKVWDFVCGGGGAEITLAANRHIFDTAMIRPRILVDVSICDTSRLLLGDRWPSPIGIAPTAYHTLLHPEGELATAQGANGAPMVVSIFAGQPLEEIAKRATGPLWLQLYWLQRRDVMTSLAKRAHDAGFRALMLTVDAPRIGRRLRDMRNGFAIPPHIQAVNLDETVMAATHQPDGIAKHAALTFDQRVTWADLAWLKSLTDLPLVLKGVLTAEDAALAVEHGVDAIVVSNHGGRQLDGAVPAMRALPEVVAAVDGRCPVLVDGGIRHGRDVFVALASGASAVLIGRPVLWALAAGGASGVGELLSLLNAEFEHTMALAGRPRAEEITRSALYG